ncbi:MAG: HAMP domain-containing sensor histidine kinase [Gemmatimonadota bacterium]
MHAPTRPTPTEPPRLHVSPGLVAALQRAREQVERDWNLIVPDAPSREEAITQLGRLCEVITEVAAGQTGDGLPQGVLARRLIELIRRYLIRDLQAEPDPAALVFLAAVEQVHERIEPDWAGHFADRLSGPDGMELVVEVAHDLRSPLTSILFLAETLQRARSGPVNQIQERQLGLIYSAAFGLSSMASDVIELARGGDRLVDLDPTPFSILDILESVRDIVQPIAEEKGLEVRLTWPQIDFRVGHPVALSRVLLNLTTNALKFTSEGFVEVMVEAGETDEVHFSVRDTGRGIPSEAMIMMFEPFRRRRGQSDYAFSGSGLGLSICRKLVEAMGSSMQVETGPDRGTRFFFSLHLPAAAMHQFGPLTP